MGRSRIDTTEEIRKQLQKLKNRKANGSDNLPIELWKLVGGAGIESQWPVL